MSTVKGRYKTRFSNFILKSAKNSNHKFYFKLISINNKCSNTLCLLVVIKSNVYLTLWEKNILSISCLIEVI